MLQDKYLNLFTDFGFKRIFGQEQSSLKVYRDLKNVLDTARDEAFEEGKAQGKAQGQAAERLLAIARNMKAQGWDTALIQQITGLNAQDIERV